MAKLTKKTVLVADDDRDVREGLQRRLNGWGYETVLVENGEQAVQRLVSETAPQVAIIDRRMPGMDGDEVCSRVREARRASEVFVIMLTGKKQPKDVASGLAAGANDYVSKPFDNHELRSRIENGFKSVASAEEVNQTASVAHDNPQRVFAQLLDENNVVPKLEARNQRFESGSRKVASGQVQSENAVTGEVLGDLKLCPKCESLPTFREGCPACGSASVKSDSMLHHFPCSYVGFRQNFLNESGELRCPKCMMTNMEVGVDFEQFAGPYQCCDCDWSGTELDVIRQCLRCDLRFPCEDSNNIGAFDYHVDEQI